MDMPITLLLVPVAKNKFHLAVQEIQIKGIIDINANTIHQAMRYVHEVVDSLKLLGAWNGTFGMTNIKVLNLNSLSKDWKIDYSPSVEESNGVALTPQGIKDEH